MVPAFRGIDAVLGIEGLVNQRGFVLIDEFQRNPKYQNIYAAGVAVASAAAGSKQVSADAPRTGYMVESAMTTAVQNIRDQIDNLDPTHKANWNAVCLANVGGGGIAFIALPQNPPASVGWFSEGNWTYLSRCTSCDVAT